MKKLVNYWYSKNSLLYLLLPLSYIYQLCVAVHRLLYFLRLKKRHNFPVPVIVIGNITVGGTGKTPFTIALANFLLQKGYKPGIVSRGYKGKAKKFPIVVTAASDPSLVGDEPVLIATHTNCPIVVAPKRVQAVKMLLERSYSNVVICDDGLQHHALKKDIEIILVDGKRKFGNGFCLPAGPLRESLKRLSQVDFIVFHDKSLAYKYSMSLITQGIYNLINPNLKLAEHFKKNKIVHALAAIGNPERFFNSLRGLGYEIVEHIFSDHHTFRKKDLDFCSKEDILVMTEKDAVKCRIFAQDNYWVLPVTAYLSEDFIKDFMVKLGSLAK